MKKTSTSTTEAAPPPSPWAARGHALVERRAALAVVRQAEVEAERERQMVPPEDLRRRCSLLIARIIEPLVEWQRAAGVSIDGETGPDRLRIALSGADHGASLTVRLSVPDGDAVVAIRGLGRGDERRVSLDIAEFDADTVASAAVREFLGHVEAETLQQQRQEDQHAAVAR